MSYGILLLRLVLGLTLAGHGAQKLFGAFGGGGPRGTAAFLGGLGFRAPLAMTLAAGVAEFGGGALVAVGLLTPLGALAIAVAMLNAIVTVHWRNGFWNTSRGYEYNLLIWTVAVALAATGAGRFSVDALTGWDRSLSGPWWALAVAAGAALVSAVTAPRDRSRSGPDTAGADERRLREAA